MEKDSNVKRNSSINQAFLKSMQNAKNNYNPFAHPIDIDICEDHYSATKIRKPDTNLNFNICKCCGNKINKYDFSMFERTSNFGNIGTSFPLFFHFIKYLIIILFVNFILTSIYYYNLDWNIFVETVSYKINNDSEIQAVSKKIFENHTYNILIIINFFILFFSKLYYVKQNKNMEALIDLKHTTPNDYSIFVFNIPKDTTEEELKLYFNNIKNSDNNNLQVYKINLCYNIKEFTDKNNEYYKLKKKILIKKFKNQYEEGEEEEDLKLIKEIKSELKQIKNKYEETHLSSKFTGVAIISFLYQRDASYILKNYETNMFSYYFRRLFRKNKLLRLKGNFLKIRTAPEPNDIFWENIGTKKIKLFINRLVSFLAGLFCVGLSALIIYLIKKEQNKIIIGSSSMAILTLSLIMSIVIAITNFLAKLLMNFLAIFENHTTYSTFSSAIVWKIIAIQFINNCIILLIININFSTKEINIFSNGTFTKNITSLIYVNCVANIIYILLNPFYILYLLKRKYISIKKDTINLFQYEANIAFTPPPMFLSESYIRIYSLLFMSLFFQTVIPFGLIAVGITFIIIYWFEKWVLLKRSSKPSNLDYTFSKSMLRLFDFSLFIYALGYLVLYNTIKNYSNNLSSTGVSSYSNVYGIIMIVIALLDIILDWNEIFKCFRVDNEEELIKGNITYEDARLNNFLTEYDRENPITKFKAKKEFIQYLNSKKKINIDIKDSIIDKIEHHIDDDYAYNNKLNYQIGNNANVIDINAIFRDKILNTNTNEFVVNDINSNNNLDDAGNNIVFDKFFNYVNFNHNLENFKKSRILENNDLRLNINNNNENEIRNLTNEINNFNYSNYNNYDENNTFNNNLYYQNNNEFTYNPDNNNVFTNYTGNIDNNTNNINYNYTNVFNNNTNNLDNNYNYTNIFNNYRK